MKLFKTLIPAISVLAFSATTAGALTLNFDSTSTSSNNPATGASGMAEFAFTQTNLDTLVTITVTNTTGSIPVFGAEATSATLVGFVFDHPGAPAITLGQVLSDFETLSLQPFGTFDVCARATGPGNCTGGNPSDGLLNGQDDEISLLYADSTAAAIESAFTDGYASGDLRAALRFQQVNAGEGSDKLLFVPGDTPTPIPLPAAAWMLVAGLGGLFAAARRRAA